MLGIGILRRVRHSLGLLTGKPLGFLPDNFPGYCVDLVGIRTLLPVISMAYYGIRTASDGGKD